MHVGNGKITRRKGNGFATSTVAAHRHDEEKEKKVNFVGMLTVVDSSYEICTTGGAARFGLYNSKGELMYKMLLGGAMLMWVCSCWLCFRIGRWLSMQPKQQHSERKKKQLCKSRRIAKQVSLLQGIGSSPGSTSCRRKNTGAGSGEGEEGGPERKRGWKVQ